MKSQWKRHLASASRYSWLLAVVVLLTGCANLEAVRKFAKTSAATADYRQVVSDYADSPIRQKRYQPQNQAARLDALAKRRADQKPNLEGAQTVLVEYMSALGDLAADDLADVSKEVDGLRSSLEKAKFVGDADGQINTETATAAASIAKVLIRAALDGWRQHQVVKIIREADPHVQVVISGLKEVVDKDFRASLQVEAESISKPFMGWQAAAANGNDPDGAPRVAAILLDEHLDRIREKQAKLDAYLKVLDTIGKGHADLNANVDKLTRKDLTARLKGYSKDLQTLYKAMQEFGG